MSAHKDTLQEQLSAWCESYIAAFEAFDVAAIGTHWVFPAMIVSGDRQVIFKDAGAFGGNTAALVGFYQEQDVSRVERAVDAVFEMTAGTAAMKVSDRMFSGAGEVIVEWASSYVLKLTAGNWRELFADASGEVNAWAARGTPLGVRRSEG